MDNQNNLNDKRKIVSGLYMSLDGIVDDPERWTGKHGEFMGKDVGELVGAMIAEGDTLLLGRTTFQQFEKFFANDTSGNPMSAAMTNVSKFVVSKTMTKPSMEEHNCN